jgi:hypothetical protein
MFSKRLKFTGLILSFVLLGLGGCLKDKAPLDQMSIGGNLSGCLNNFDRTIRDYFNGRASDDDVGGLFDCTTNALDLFMRHTRGDQIGIYLPEELRIFLQRYFLNEKRITDSLLRETMFLKQAIVGGSIVELKAEELQVTIDMLKAAKEEALRLRPYMPIEPDHFNNLRGKELEEGLNMIQSTGAAVGRLLTRAVQNYSLQNFSNLLLELQSLLEEGTEGRGPRILRDNLQVFGAAKRILFGGPSGSIQPNEWSVLTSMGSRWYSLYLRNENLLARQYVNWRDKTGEGESWLRGQALDDFDRLVSLTRSLLGDVLKFHPGSTISFQDLQTLIESLTAPPPEDFGLIGKSEAWRPFDRELSGYLKSSLMPLVQKLLGGTDYDDNGRNAGGITAGLLSRVRNEFGTWLTEQKYIEALFKKLGGDSAFDSPGYTREELLKAGSRFSGQFKSAELLPQKVVEAGASDLHDVIANYRPYFYGNSAKVYFPDGDPANQIKGSLYSFNNLSRVNWTRAIGRLLFSGYSSDPKRAKNLSGLEEDEADRFYWDFRSLGVKLGVLDPTSTGAGRKRFKEGKLFTSHASLDKLLSLGEGMELFSFLFSSGKVSNDIMEDLRKNCPTGSEDAHGNVEIEPQCFRARFGSQFATMWDHMPGMVAYYKKLSPANQQAFIRSLEAIGRRVGATESQPVDHFEVEVIVTVLHYVEALFLKNDINRNGTIDLAEAQSAFTLFRSILLQHPAVQANHLTEDADLRAIFTYLVGHNGDVPDTAAFIWWRYVASWSDIHADRGNIINIFANLSF